MGRAGGKLDKMFCHIPTWFLACLYRVCFIVSESKVELNTSLTSNASSAALRRSSPFPKFGICSKSNKPASSSSIHLYQWPGEGVDLLLARLAVHRPANVSGANPVPACTHHGGLTSLMRERTDGQHRNDTKCKEWRKSGEHDYARTSISAASIRGSGWLQLPAWSCPIAAHSPTRPTLCPCPLSTAAVWGAVRTAMRWD